MSEDASAGKLEALWSDRKLRELTSRASRTLTDDAADWAPPPGVVPKREPVRLGVGIPDPESLPRDALRAAFERALRSEGDKALRYHFGPGLERLRDQLAERYNRNRGLTVDRDWFRLANGSAGAIDLICRTLIDPGDVILSEAPSYMGTLHNFRGVQAELRSVGMDQEGLRTDELARALTTLAREGRRAKLLYTIASFQNPMGLSMSLRRRHELLELAAEHDLLILEDDAYSELWFDAPPPPSLFSLARGHGVIAVGTFSKILATGLRVGWVHARPEWIELFARMRFDMGQSVAVHRSLAEFIAAGELEPHVARVRQIYREKARVLCDALEEHAGGFLSFRRPEGGFYLWVELRRGLTAEALWRAGAEEGVWFPGGTSFFPDRTDPTGEHIRLAFPYTTAPDLQEGARRIGLACERLAGDRVA